MKTTPWHLVLLLISGAVLSSCGADSNPAGNAGASGNPQTKVATSGAITGFGSVIVEGVRYDDTGAVVQEELDSTNPSDATLSDLKLGMQVELEAENGRARSIRIRPEVIAIIESITSNGFTAAGQTVVVSEETVFDGATGPGELMAGDYVKVHGERDDTGQIIATRVKRKDPANIRSFRVAGTAHSVNAAARTLMIADLMVTWSDTTRVSPSAAQIVDGMRIAVYSEAAPQNGNLDAKAIRIQRVSDDTDTAHRRLSGHVRNLNNETNTFDIRGYSVEVAEQTSYVNGLSTDLVKGRKVFVLGSLVIGDTGIRTIKASEIRFHKKHEHRHSLRGIISDFDGENQTFIVRGVMVDASAELVQFIGGDATMLANDVNVKVTGSVSGDKVTARTIQFVATGSDDSEQNNDSSDDADDQPTDRPADDPTPIELTEK